MIGVMSSEKCGRGGEEQLRNGKAGRKNPQWRQQFQGVFEETVRQSMQEATAEVIRNSNSRRAGEGDAAAADRNRTSVTSRRSSFPPSLRRSLPFMAIRFWFQDTPELSGNFLVPARVQELFTVSGFCARSHPLSRDESPLSFRPSLAFFPASSTSPQR